MRKLRSALILLSALCAPSALASPPDHAAALFEASSELPAARSRAVSVARARAVRARADRLTSDRLLLNLFDDVQVTARRTKLDRTRTGATVWRGRLESPHDGYATVTSVAGGLAATVYVDSRVFEVTSTGRDHEVRELLPSAFPSDDGHAPEPDLPGTSVTEPVVAADTANQLDVLIVWTPAARNAVGGTDASIRSLAELAVANANTAYVNSGVTTGLRLVYAGEVTHVEGSISADLSALQSTSDTVLNQVHQLRDQYGADVVTLLGSGYAASGYCGIGYLMTSPSTSFAAWAFNVVDQSCAAGNLSYAHEVGHNQGLQHDPANSSSAPSYPYAYGYQDGAGAFRTVMSYGTAPRVPHLSNPTVLYNGRPTGVADTQDNARALNGTALTVANFRAAVTQPCTFTVSPTSLSFAAGSGTSSVTVTTQAGCSWTTSSGATWATVTGGATGNGTVTINVTANTSTASRSATLTIAGQTVTITQAGSTSCSYTVSPTSLSFGAGTGSATVTVTTTAGCAWTTSSGAPWATVGAGSTGSGSVTVTVAANSATSSRSTTVTIAGRSVTISQAAAAATCSYSVSPTSLSFAAAGGTASVTVTTQSTCAWTTSSSVSWVRVGAGRTGSGSVTVTVAPYTGNRDRSATITIAGRSVTVTQQRSRGSSRR